MEKVDEIKTSRYYECKDHLPEPYRKVIGYDSNTETYSLCLFSPENGWLGLNQGHFGAFERLNSITHWLDVEVELPFLSFIDEKLKELEKEDDDA